MTSAAKATNAPVTVTYKEVEYKMRGLTRNLWGEFQQWMRDDYWQSAKLTITPEPDEDLPPEEREKIEAKRDRETEKILAYMHRLGPATEAGLAATNTFNGQYMTWWLSLKNDNPDLTQDEFHRLIVDDPESMLVFAEGFNRANSSERPTKEPEDNPQEIPQTASKSSTGSTPNSTDGAPTSSAK